MKSVILSLLIVLSFVSLSFSAGGGGGGGRSQPSCGQDTWTCTDFGTCTKEGTANRTCILTTDCPSSDTPKPPEVASCTYVSNLLSTLKCQNLTSIKQRISCRLSLTSSELSNELSISYLPEECRSLSDDIKKENCVLLYARIVPCYSKIGSALLSCLSTTVNLTKGAKEELVACKLLSGTQRTACFSNIKDKELDYVKFKFYYLEEAAEKLLDDGKITKEAAVDFISAAEIAKQDFNNATLIKDKKDVVLGLRTKWKELIAGVKQ
ncbi:hypothetical protein HZC07_00860 [Candidatus Micrarchaeota archaeon]|nr:hypothetical protein [Candidatus Micrarchaeota archaeon]